MRKHATANERFGQPAGRDVFLLVGSACNRRTFVLSESILRQLGPRWKCLLSSASTSSGHCSSRLHRRPKTLNLRDDRPESIRIVLLIATLQFDKVPKVLDFSDIVHVTDVAVRYEAHSLLAGYMDGWLDPYRDRLRSRGYEEWLYIAKQFGYEAEYAQLAEFLVVNCEVDPSGKKLVRSGSPCAIGGRVPLDTLAQIHDNRTQLLGNMLKATYDLWTSISRGTNCRCAEPDSITHQQCAAINFLALTDHLRGLGLFPMLTAPASIQYSPGDLALRLSGLPSTVHIAHGMTARRRSSAPAEPTKHSRCHFGFRLRAKMVSIVGDMTWPGEGSGVAVGREGEDVVLMGPLDGDPNVLNVR